MPLSAAGITVPTAAEFLTLMIAEWESLTGLALDQTRTDDQFVMASLTILAEQLGATAELVQQVYDGTHVDAALGIQMEDAASLVGVEPDPATYSSATVTCAGTNGTVIPVGSLVEGGGQDDDARWVVSEDVTISGGSVDVVVTAQIAGPTTAAIGAIDKIVTGVPGWDSVTNAAAADPGEARETDAQLRRRRRRALQVTAAASTASIRASLLDLDFVQEVVVIQNASNLANTVSGKSMTPNSSWVFLTPSSLTSAQEVQIAAALHRRVPAGTELLNSGGGSAVVKDVTDRGGSTSREVSWDYGSDDPTTLTVTVVLEPGYVLADVSQGIKDALEAFFENDIGMGDTLTEFDMLSSVARSGLDGISTISITASVGALPYAPDIDKTVVVNDYTANITVTT